MSQGKYEKYVLTNMNTVPDHLGTRLFCLNDAVLPGAPYVDLAWFWPRSESLDIVKAHTHPFDEVITFWGSNPDDPGDLCGEVEFWMEDEQYLLTRSCIIFVPRGVRHCPLVIRRADRPIFHFATSPESKHDGSPPQD